MSINNYKRSFTQALAQYAEDAAMRGDSRTVYKITKELCGKASVTEQQVNYANGQLIYGEEYQITRCRDLFCSVLNHVLDGDESTLQTDFPNKPSIRINEYPTYFQESS